MPNDRYFILDPSPWAEKNLLPSIEKGALIMLYSARASGKTTKVNFLLTKLQTRYHCILYGNKWIFNANTLFIVFFVFFSIQLFVGTMCTYQGARSFLEVYPQSNPCIWAAATRQMPKTQNQRTLYWTLRSEESGTISRQGCARNRWVWWIIRWTLPSARDAAGFTGTKANTQGT